MVRYFPLGLLTTRRYIRHNAPDKYIITQNATIRHTENKKYLQKKVRLFLTVHIIYLIVAVKLRSGHTHPFNDWPMGSNGDIEILKLFKNEWSIVYNSFGKRSLFDKEGNSKMIGG